MAGICQMYCFFFFDVGGPFIMYTSYTLQYCVHIGCKSGDIVFCTSSPDAARYKFSVQYIGVVAFYETVHLFILKKYIQYMNCILVDQD